MSSGVLSGALGLLGGLLLALNLSSGLGLSGLGSAGSLLSGLLLGQSGSGATELAGEALDATGVVNELLLASVEGVASVAKLDGELRNGRVGLEGVASGATDGALDVLGVDTLLHDKTPYGR